MSDFPNSFDVPGRLVDGLDFLDGLTLDEILQGAHAPQLALGVNPWVPDGTSAWNFPGAQSVANTLKELCRIEAGEKTIHIPVGTYGSYDVPLKNASMFTHTSTNNVPFFLWGEWAARDGDKGMFLEGEEPWEYPNLNPQYDTGGNLWGFRVKPLLGSGNESSSVLRYIAVEANW